jgi:ABC-type amino acid transport substrate-binding protein
MDWIKKQKNILILLGGIIIGATLIVFLFDLLSIRLSDFSFENEKYSPYFPTLKVGIDENYPPYEYIENGIPKGYNIDIIRAAAYASEYNVEFNAKPWIETLNNIKTGQVDVLAGMYISSTRENTFSFSLPHTYISAGLFSKKDSHIQTLDDVIGKKVVVQEGDIMCDYLHAQGLDTTIIYAKAPEEMIQTLITDEADAALFSSIPQGQYYLDKYNIENIQIIDLDQPPQSYAFSALKEK